jgi:protein-disulfide isomerase
MTKLKRPVVDSDHQKGAAEAKVILVEYGDYQCPYCGHAYPLLQHLLDEFSVTLLFVFRNFPLRKVHPLALKAAYAAEAAGVQGRFWEMHDLIFTNQKKLRENSFSLFASSLGLNVSLFETDMQSPAIISIVEADFMGGLRSGLNATPSFFINESKLNSYDGSYLSLKNAIDEILVQQQLLP